jgi:hypothetical protein
MRIAQTKFAVAVCAAVGLIALAGVGTALALAPQPAPVVAEPLAPANEQPAPKADGEPLKVDRKWDGQRPFPSAFPDVAELSEESLDKFESEHVAHLRSRFGAREVAESQTARATGPVAAGSRHRRAVPEAAG